MREGALRSWSPAAIALVSLLAHGSGAPPIHAQPQGITPSILLRTSVSGDEGKEAVIGIAEFAVGATTGLHTHPGDEYATVLEGTLEIRVEGKEPRRVGAGGAYHNPKGIVHETRNAGATPARVVGTFIIEKGRPLSEPVAGRRE